MSEIHISILAFIAAGAIILALFFWLIAITIAFKRVEEVERLIATPGKQLDMIRNTWRGSPMGRWMRVTHVFNFFLFRNIPRYGPIISARMGDETEPVPSHLKLWVIFPVGIALILTVVFFTAAGVGMAFDH